MEKLPDADPIIALFGVFFVALYILFVSVAVMLGHYEYLPAILALIAVLVYKAVTTPCEPPKPPEED